MLERSIPALLKLFPRGLTDDQLVWRLKQGGLRAEPSLLLAALHQLGARGEVRRQHDRWLTAEQSPTTQRAETQPGNVWPATTEPAVLRSILASFVDRPTAEAGPAPDEDALGTEVSWRAAVSYFAATQRRDPRGTIACFPDQHGSLWQLFHGSGRWWERAEVRIASQSLAGAMREALSRAGQEGRSCRECCRNSLAARSGHVKVRVLRRRGQGASARWAETGSPIHRPCASGSGRKRVAPRAASARFRRRAARSGS